LPAYREAGKVYFNIALGCTGGRHRSVTTAEQLAARLRDQGWPTAVRHRELDRAAGRPTTTVSPLEAAQALPAQPRAAGRRNPWHRPADRAGGETG
ncbi:MAG: RNase adapter RapZ, partial [Pseudomonadota bacterium]